MKNHRPGTPDMPIFPKIFLVKSMTCVNLPTTRPDLISPGEAPRIKLFARKQKHDMKIRDEHLYHGAALTQIAEHPSFTAINGVRDDGSLHRSAFRVNDSIGVYFKYASKPKAPHSEYLFTFNSEHLNDLAKLNKKLKKLFIGLVCVKDGEICCLSYSLLCEMLDERRKRIVGEDAHTILVTVPKGKQLRVYMNAPGRKRTMLTEHLVARNAFPDELFES